jgi:hypothetical protein
MALLKSKNWTQRNVILSALNEESPKMADKGFGTEKHSIVLEISSKVELLLHCLKLNIPITINTFTSFYYN